MSVLKISKNHFATFNFFVKMKLVSTVCIYMSLCKSGYFQCHNCKATFDTDLKLQDHICKIFLKRKKKGEPIKCEICHKLFKRMCTLKHHLATGKSLSEALLIAEHGENMLCTKIVQNVRNNFCTQHVLPRFKLGILMY